MTKSESENSTGLFTQEHSWFDFETSFFRTGCGVVQESFIDWDGRVIEFSDSFGLWLATHDLWEEVTLFFGKELEVVKLEELTKQLSTFLDIQYDFIADAYAERGDLDLGLVQHIQDCKEMSLLDKGLHYQALESSSYGEPPRKGIADEIEPDVGLNEFRFGLHGWKMAGALDQLRIMTVDNLKISHYLNAATKEMAILNAVRADRNARAKKAAQARHKENKDIKKEGLDFYLKNAQELSSLSNAAVARKIAKLVPITERQATKWISEARNSEKHESSET
jgi:hypothetical protein